MGYVLLVAAICTEVAATLSLRASAGLSKPGFVVVMVLGYACAFTCLALALEHGLTLGAAYALWAAVGVAAVAVLSVPLFGESFTPVQMGGLLLVVAGVAAIEAGAGH